MSSLADALGTSDAQDTKPDNVPAPADVKTEDGKSFALDGPGDVSMDPADADVAPKDEVASVEADEPMDDLFGEENEEEPAGREGTSTPGSHVAQEHLSSPERQQRRELEYEEADEPNPVFEQILEAAVQIPNIPLPKSSDGNHWVIRMPNFVKMDSKPFHPETYVGPEHDDEDVQAETSVREKSMSIKLKVENTVRWKWTKDAQGNDKRQSNSRVVRWSDGSLSLLLGKELFDITQTVDQSAAVPRSSIGTGSQASQSQVPDSQPGSSQGAKSQGLTYLVAQHKRAFILQSEAVVTGYMSLRPTGMQSETHRMLVRAVGQKHNKVARLRMAPDPTRDPERELQEEIKRDARRPRKSRVVAGAEDDEDMLGLGTRKKRRTGGGGGGGRRRQRASMWSDDDEDEEEVAYSEEEEDEGGSRSGSPKKKKVKAVEEKRGGDYVADDFLVADTDEEGGGEDSEGDTRRKRRKRKPADEQSEEDPLDAMDAKIAQQLEESKRKQERPPGDADSDEGEKMDIESEEEEQEFKVRRTGGTARRKRAVDLDDDDEE